MAKYSGKIGYAITEEIVDDENPNEHTGVWVEKIVERSYKGDIVRNTKKYESTDTLNSNITISNTIEIVADQYAFENYFAIRYVTWMGAKWIVNNIEVRRPRLILTVGGLYNEQTTS